jgi:hypothetical protein
MSVDTGQVNKQSIAMGHPAIKTRNTVLPSENIKEKQVHKFKDLKQIVF